ncbi:hypothetical protein JCM18694_09060 [Prolixibacter denitrificans]|uniref:Uncharacterized protein n=1 Tax=Prolixibacter denitrificans TaxID=1541063 RepID=A0ABQ0ZGV7_9BACT|nr:hypothetical protein JCM18694_09060 [Prolixibacter denitrificans]
MKLSNNSPPVLSTNSILYIDSKGKLHRLYCPFKAVVTIDASPLKRGDIVTIEAVKVTSEWIDIYIVENRGYYYYCFRITL